MRARLIEDGGRAASSPDDFFRSPEFLAAESVTHSLVVEAGGVGVRGAVPLIVRDIPGAAGRQDAVSPYGYPGGALAGDPIDPALVDWSGAGLVSAFIREAAGDPVFSIAGERSLLQIADPREGSAVRPRLLEQIRATERAGYRVERFEDPGGAEREAFRAIYTETMERAEAAERYFYGPGYFERILGAPTADLVLCSGPGDVPAAAAIAVRSDDVLHYYLGGSADAHLPASPMKNLFAAMIEIAADIGMPLNLGGGLTPGDGLERFKRGFANTTLPFQTSELVLDQGAYDRLSEEARPASSSGDDAGGDASSASSFFPSYRA